MIMMAIMGIENELDRDIILRIYVQHYGIMKRKAATLVDNESIAEDIVQDSMLELIKRADTLRSLSEPQVVAYVVRTVASHAIDYHRKNKRSRKNYSVEQLTEDRAEDMVDSEESIEDGYDKKELYLQLGNVLRQLPERDKNVLYMKHYFGYTDKEIGTKLGVSSGSVRMMLTRARNKVKEHMKLAMEGGSKEDEQTT